MEFQKKEEGENYWLSNTLPEVKEEFDDYEDHEYTVMFESDSLYIKDLETKRVARYRTEEEFLEDIRENTSIEDIFKIDSHIDWDYFKSWDPDNEKFYVRGKGKHEWVSTEEPVTLNDKI